MGVGLATEEDTLPCQEGVGEGRWQRAEQAEKAHRGAL